MNWIIPFLLFTSSLLFGQTEYLVYAIDCPGETAPKAFLFDGIDYKEVLKPSRSEGDKFYFSVPESMPYLFFGINELESKGVLMTKEEGAYLVCNCNRFSKARVVKSPLNEQLDGGIKMIEASEKTYLSTVKQYYAADRKEKRELKKELNALVSSRKDSLKKFGGVGYIKDLSSLYWSNLSLDEKSYSAAFQKGIPAHLTSLDLGYQLPQSYSYFSYLTDQVNDLKLKEADKASFLKGLLGKLDADQRKFAYSAIVDNLMRSDIVLGMNLGSDYVKTYEEEYPNQTRDISRLIAKYRSETIGEEAPNLVGKAPDGSTVDLKDLRGKYVLLDFWASWCGPCRRENPNVVKVYNQYKDKGFDILGVSLDKNQGSWEKAIKSDKLSWKHISDLKGWSSSHAKLYGVRSVPHTVLLDPEGRIIATRLRAHTLSQKLAEIFGS